MTVSWGIVTRHRKAICDKRFELLQSMKVSTAVAQHLLCAKITLK